MSRLRCNDIVAPVGFWPCGTMYKTCGRALPALRRSCRAADKPCGVIPAQGKKPLSLRHDCTDAMLKRTAHCHQCDAEQRDSMATCWCNSMRCELVFHTLCIQGDAHTFNATGHQQALQNLQQNLSAWFFLCLLEICFLHVFEFCHFRPHPGR